MKTSPIRILVVEDFEPLRNLVRTILEKDPTLHIIAELSDGLEAVQKAADLDPDLILLDVGLPHLSGFDAARFFRKLVPRSRVLFFSQDFSPAMVNEAMSLGGCGYVVKIRAATDLLPAIDAVRLGKIFVSGE